MDSSNHTRCHLTLRTYVRTQSSCDRELRTSKFDSNFRYSPTESIPKKPFHSHRFHLTTYRLTVIGIRNNLDSLLIIAIMIFARLRTCSNMVKCFAPK